MMKREKRGKDNTYSEESSNKKCHNSELPLSADIAEENKVQNDLCRRQSKRLQKKGNQDTKDPLAYDLLDTVEQSISKPMFFQKPDSISD